MDLSRGMLNTKKGKMEGTNEKRALAGMKEMKVRGGRFRSGRKIFLVG